MSPTSRAAGKTGRQRQLLPLPSDYVDIRFQEEVRYKKPVGIYWLQAAAVRTAEALGASDPRTTIWLYRLPSLIGAIGAVLLTYWTALAFGTRRTAYLSALMLACSLLLGVEARLAKTDTICCSPWWRRSASSHERISKRLTRKSTMPRRALRRKRHRLTPRRLHGVLAGG
jgi:hypothetical protein